MRYEISIADELSSKLEAAQRKQQEHTSRLRTREAERVKKDAAKLVGLLVEKAHEAANDGRALLIHGVVPRKSLIGTADYEHVPPAVTRLQELGLGADAYSTDTNVPQMVIDKTTPNWRRAYRQCVIVRLS